MFGYRVAADTVLILHALFIAFVIFGLILIWIGYFAGWSWTRGLKFRIAHLLAITYIVVQSFAQIACPLTELENNLRIRGGQEPYADTGCIAYWLHRAIFFQAPSWVFTVVYTAFGLLVVATLIFAPPRRTRRSISSLQPAQV